MDDWGIVRLFWSPATPLWGLFLVVLVTAIRMSPQWMERWLAFVQARRAARDQDMTRLREEVGRLSDRVEQLEHKVEECESDRATWMSRAIKAEASLDGMGEVRQAAANAAAEVRLDAIDKAARTGGGKGKSDATS